MSERLNTFVENGAECQCGKAWEDVKFHSQPKESSLKIRALLVSLQKPELSNVD